MTYRVKCVIATNDCIDAHYWHEPTLAKAIITRDELRVDLAEVADVHLYIYADTRHGHVRVA